MKRTLLGVLFLSILEYFACMALSSSSFFAFSAGVSCLAGAAFFLGVVFWDAMAFKIRVKNGYDFLLAGELPGNGSFLLEGEGGACNLGLHGAEVGDSLPVPASVLGEVGKGIWVFLRGKENGD